MSDGLSELGRAALWYVENGFGVFPLKPNGKRPNCPHGLNDWTDNPDDIRKWWADHPNDNIGIACGTPSGGLLVLDFDVDEQKDKDGLATLYEWEKAHGELPETAVAITGRGGMHYLYRTDRTNIHPSVNHELSVDVRCDGSYIVAPPSVHENGRKYEWQDSPEDIEIATATGPVYDFLDHVQRNGGKDETKKDNGKFKLPEVIKKGNRDTTLFRWASHLRGIGRSDEEIMAAVAGVNALRCRPPMDSKDVERIVRSACRYEQRDDDSDGRTVGRPGGEVGGIRGPRGGLLTNKVAQVIMRQMHARKIDGVPAVWTGTRWDYGCNAIERAVLQIADDAKKKDRSEVVSYIQTMAPEVDSESAFDGRYYVQFANCTYDVLADEVVQPRPEMFIMATLPIELDMDVARNLADEFIEQVSGNDPTTKAALCEVIGASMCSRPAMDKSVFFIGRAGGANGNASNGKSTFIRFLRSIIGSGNVSSLDIEELGDDYGPGCLVGKLANLGDDIPASYLSGAKASKFKKFVTSDVLHAKVKYADEFDFKPVATMVFSMNEVPRMAESGDQIIRRLQFVPFRARFSPGTPGFDRNLAQKLASKDVLRRGALLGLMALGDLIRRGEPTIVPDMAAEVAEVRHDNDNVIRWLVDECVARDDIEGRLTDDVYQDYRNWCEKSGVKNWCEKGFFTRRVNRSGYFEGVTLVTAFRKVGGKAKRCYSFNDGEKA